MKIKIKCLRQNYVNLSYKYNSILFYKVKYVAYYLEIIKINKIKDDEIFLKYNNFDNGSHNQIAGIMNTDNFQNVFGMMPHPEKIVISKILFKMLFYNKISIDSKINKLLQSEHISYKSTKNS